MGSAKKGTLGSAKSTTASRTKRPVFTEEERAAIKEAIQERRGIAAGGAKVEGDNAVLGKIATFSEPDRGMGTKLHHLVRGIAPTLVPRLWYGMPAYSKEGKVVCWFQPAQKFKTRYAMLGFSDEANLDEGALWPVAFALSGWSATEEAKVATLVKQAVR